MWEDICAGAYRAKNEKANDIRIIDNY